MQKPQKSTVPITILYGFTWLFFVYLFFQILDFKAEQSNNLLLSGLYFIEFGVHEASHIVVSFLPSILVAAAGSIGEMSFTWLFLFATLKEKSYFASVFASLWVMLAMHSAGRYMADARSQLLPLIGPGDTVKHDWNYVFGQLGWLRADTAIGGTVSMIGTVFGAAGLLFGLYLIILRYKTPLK